MNGVAALSVFSLSACRLMLCSLILAIGFVLMPTFLLADDVFADELLDDQSQEQEDPISRDLNAFDIIYPAIHHMLSKKNARQDMTAQLLNMNQLSANHYEYTVVDSDTVSVVGTYEPISGIVDIMAQRGDQLLSSTSDNGRFELELPFQASGDEWVISIVPQAGSINPVELRLTLLAESKAPVVTLSESTVTINSGSYSLSGTVISEQVGIDTVIATSSRFVGTEFAVFVADDQQISADIPVLSGDNQITVIATDADGRYAQAQVMVTRTVSEAPVIEITAPTRNTTLAESLDITGVVYTSLAAADIRVTLDGDIFFPDADAPDGAYAFAFKQRSLIEGLNTFLIQVETVAGSAEATVHITRQLSPEEADPPILNITSPTTQSFMRNDDDRVFISGSVVSASGPVTLTVNGQPVSLLGSTNVQTFSTQVSIADSDGEYSIVIAATDVDGRRTEQTITVIRDTLAPSITLDNTELELAPTVNAVTELPYPISGKITEANLASLTFNGQSLSLVPTGEPHTFTFEADVSLPIATDTELMLLATDFADNQYALNYIVNANPATLIDLITPAVDTVLSVDSAEASLQVLARLSDVQPDMTAQVSLNNGDATTVTIQSDGMISTDVPLVDVNQAQQVLKLSILNGDNQVISQTERRFTVENLDALPLSVQIEPVNGAMHVDPNESIRLLFDRVIDPDLLELDIRESANGLTFVVEREDNPTDFPSVSNAKPITVNRVQESVPGELGVLLDDTAVIFQPDRFYAYGGDVYITVNYDGEQLMRARFSVREIPTFVQANVVDQQGQPLKGIPVEIPDADLRTVTNSNGSFSFGFGLPPEKQLPSGQVKLIFNRNSQVADFGEVSQFFYLKHGHLNRIGTTQIPLLSQDIAYRPLSSGQSMAVLANGELELNLSEAQLLFPDGRNKGSVHVQFTPNHMISHDVFRAAMPQWLFALQPAGITVEGTLDLAIKVPALQGSYDYIPDQRFYVVMVGLDLDTLTIMPTGVGIIENRRVTARLTQQKSLDYMGYVLVSIDQSILEKVYEGSLSIEELMVELEQLL